jgi:uncharacterized membrane protein YeaQ/YmgE (transglycosylase-associated protein family)
MGILGWILLGLIAGWLAGILVKGSGYGIIGDMILGILGALVGGWIGSRLMGLDVTGFNLESLVVAVLGGHSSDVHRPSDRWQPRNRLTFDDRRLSLDLVQPAAWRDATDSAVAGSVAFRVDLD